MNFDHPNTIVKDIPDWIDYFKKHLVMGLELELDYKDEFVREDGIYDDESGDTLPNEYREDLHYKLYKTFGIKVGCYHSKPSCKVCGQSECYAHMPDNLIRAITEDSTIEGLEFIIYGNNLTSKEFSSRLPLDLIKRDFYVTDADSCHVHLLLPNQKKTIPSTFLRNLYQMYRRFYPAYAYLFGNNKESILRQDSFSRWNEFSLSALMHNISFLKAKCDRYGFNFNTLQLVSTISRDEADSIEYYTDMDIEFRTADASLDMGQIVALRATAKAMFLRAVEISEYGIMQIPKKEMIITKKIIELLNSHKEVGNEMRDVMKAYSKNLLVEISPYLDTLEVNEYNKLMEEPIHSRTWNNKWKALSEHKKLDISYSGVAPKLIKAMKMRSIRAPTPVSYKWKASRKFKASEKTISNTLSKLGAKWHVEAQGLIL